jgi:hypothetical protein
MGDDAVSGWLAVVDDDLRQVVNNLMVHFRLSAEPRTIASKPPRS